MLITRLLARLSRPACRSVDYDNILPMFDMGEDIPHNIIQIYLTNGAARKFHSSISDTIDKLRRDNPGWSYLLFDDQTAESFILNEYGEDMLMYYHRIDPSYGASRADFLRYLAVYRLGGVYLDVKSTFTKPLDELVRGNELFIIPVWSQTEHTVVPDDIRGKLLLNPVIMSCQGHPFLRQLIIDVMKAIDTYNPFEDGIGWGGVMAITGPWRYSRTINRATETEGCGSNLFKSKDIIAEDGYVVTVFGNYEGKVGTGPVTYHQQNGMSDYRKNCSPIVHNVSWILDQFNRVALKWLAGYRNRDRVK